MGITDLVPIPSGINKTVTNAKQITMLTLLGNPREWYDQQCRDVTNPKLAALMVSKKIGPLNVRGLAPAVDALGEIVVEISDKQPAVYQGLGSVGMLGVRCVRGSTTAISNHSWGTAIDLMIDGILDARGDNRVLRGLAEIAPIFNRHGWFWGAGFGTEDGMHFECGDALTRRWHQEGRFGSPGPQPAMVLSLGDRGPEVRQLQQRLRELGTPLLVDGDFGRATLAAVIAFQAVHGIDIGGVVGPITNAALGLA